MVTPTIIMCNSKNGKRDEKALSRWGLDKAKMAGGSLEEGTNYSLLTDLDIISSKYEE